MLEEAIRSDVTSGSDGVVAAMASCVADCLVVVDGAGHVTFANEGAFLLLGIHPEGTPSDDSMHRVEDLLRLLRFVDSRGAAHTWAGGPLSWALGGGRVDGLELRETSAAPERYLRLSSSPIVCREATPSGAVVALHDLSMLHRAEERLESVVEIERRRSSQLRSLNQLAVAVNSESEPGRILDEILGGALRLTRAAVGAVYLPVPGGLRLQAFITIPELGEVPHGSGGGRMDLKEVAQRAVAGHVAVRMAEEIERADGRFLGYMGVPLAAREGALLACIVLAGSPNPIGFTAEDEVVVTTLAAHAEVALENLQRLATERDTALFLQRAMLPRNVRVPGLRVDHVYESATDAAVVGGDFYDVIAVSGTKVAVVVGDVCGKGLPAATFMSFVRHLLRVQAAMGLPPGEWLDAANAALASDPETPAFVTVALAVIDTSSGTVELALAGHPPPLVATPSGVVGLDGIPGLPLGVNPDLKYLTSTFHLGREDTLCLYTDGLYEARREDSFFGEAGLSRALAECSQGALEGSAAGLVSRAREFAGERLLDDVVVMLARLSEA